MVGSDRAQSTPKPPSSPVVAAKPHTTIMSEGKGKTRAIMLFSVVGLAIGALISTSLITTYWQISERQSQLQIQAVGCPLCTFPAPSPTTKTPTLATVCLMPWAADRRPPRASAPRLPPRNTHVC